MSELATDPTLQIIANLKIKLSEANRNIDVLNKALEMKQCELDRLLSIIAESDEQPFDAVHTDEELQKLIKIWNQKL